MGYGILPGISSGRRFILYKDHKPLETLGTLHTKTMNRLQLAMMDLDFEIRYKKGSEMPADLLSRSFTEINNTETKIDAFEKQCHLDQKR
jgi:hypothetical protein